ncbi:ABC transporter [Variovorax paradoxus]|jgi:ABC-type multidrug transport system ATPase subunit|uniref:ABC transporter ATP-binding protein n=1 Tax=Variovorax paradoxus TaxID=34073 RepID=UPI0006E69734|nr:ABC transporter [Variovorax paradoxus]KPU94066.1 ABC transporter [Variovorax paradoxus]KPU96739.1 ABC transporter [Variovorax paradoxus]KPV14607.1 ABC transporter [Variovorax paradoxus]KPV23521.1 ABC transporter [Variovorax paradoxus]
MNPASTAPILVVKNLSFAYPRRPALLSAWSASVGAGLTQLYGGDGSGKSTILRLLAGKLRGEGQLNLAGARLDQDPDTYGRNVFFVDPETDAFNDISATQCTLSLSAGDPGFDEAKWRAFVEGFSLTPHLEKPMYMLSTGSKRKVWLAAALASGRALTLLDEPTAALDANSIRFLWRTLFESAGRDDRAIVIASAERIDAVPLSGLIELPSS